MDISEENRAAWNEASRSECEWSIPVTKETIDKARAGDWNVILTPRKTVPKDWFPELKSREVLCLASGGGQQVPILAATGANVISFDISDEQLELDEQVAAENNLTLEAMQGSMTDLSCFEENRFDLIFNPASSLFIEDMKPVWAECHRVLKPGGVLLSGAMNPSFFLFNHAEAQAEGQLIVKYPLPYSDLPSLDQAELDEERKERKTVEFGHTLGSLIGDQIKAGFHITGFYEDYWSDSTTLLNVYSPTSFATKALKQA